MCRVSKRLLREVQRNHGLQSRLGNLGDRQYCLIPCFKVLKRLLLHLHAEGLLLCFFILSKMINVLMFLLFLPSRIADDTCDSSRQNCELITSKDNYANFYTSSLQRNIMNISSTLTLNDGVKIPIFGLGVYQASAGQETRRAVTWALEKGYRQIDTAARYMNEESVGQAIRNSKIRRENVFVVTKLYDDDHGFDETLKAFNDSLGKLGLEYVDLYLMHSPVPDKVLPSWNAMVKLQQQGLIRFVAHCVLIMMILTSFKYSLFPFEDVVSRLYCKLYYFMS